MCVCVLIFLKSETSLTEGSGFLSWLSGEEKLGCFTVLIERNTYQIQQHDSWLETNSAGKWYNDDAFHSPRLQERHFLSGENSNDRRLLTSSHSILPLFLHIRNTWINNSELKHHHRTFLFTLH